MIADGAIGVPASEERVFSSREEPLARSRATFFARLATNVGMRGNRWLCIVVLIGCGTEPRTDDPRDPPPPVDPPAVWGKPMSGGTLLVTRDGKRAVIADPDRDRIVIVDFGANAVSETIPLAAGSEPGRVIEDGAGRIHVALRGSGELVTLGSAPRAICGEPRGIAWEEKTDLVHVACATGELVSVPAAGGEPERVLRLDRDLRDVLVRDRGLVVTTFRSAELLEITEKGRIANRFESPVTTRPPLPPFSCHCILNTTEEPERIDALPEVAWRTIALPDGRLVMLHQRRMDAPLQPTPSGYQSGCGGPVESALTVHATRKAPFAVKPVLRGALPVDVAVHPSGDMLAVLTAGDKQVTLVPTSRLTLPDEEDDCTDRGNDLHRIQHDWGLPSSVAYAPRGDLLVFYPDYDVLVVNSSHVIKLSGDVSTSSAREIFHAQTSVGMACASCHPEGRDDGQVWFFETLGPRRTMTLGGGILARAPFHWSGDMLDLSVLMTEVFSLRMGGHVLEDFDMTALGAWLDRIPAPKGVVIDADAVARGLALFNAKEVGCAECHGGASLTNNALVDVGTGAKFKVPTLLGVGARAPFLHDGCAVTLADRFGTCGGNAHGHTSHLTSAQLADLIAYLESL